MTKRFRVALIGALTAAMLTLAVPAAFAAPLVNPWATADVTLHPEGEAGGPVLLISGELSPDVKLPAIVSLSVPKGAEVIWVGEVLGGDVGSDIEASHTVQPGETYDEIVFTLTKARRGQVEVDAAKAVSGGADSRTATLSWTSNADIPSFRAVMRMLPGAQVLKMSAEASPNVGPDGSTYYVLPSGPIKRGQNASFSITYKPGAGQTSSTGGQGTGTGTGAATAGPSPVIFVALALVVLAFLLVWSRRRPAEGEDDEAVDAEGEPIEDDSLEE